MKKRVTADQTMKCILGGGGWGRGSVGNDFTESDWLGTDGWGPTYHQFSTEKLQGFPIQFFSVSVSQFPDYHMRGVKRCKKRKEEGKPTCNKSPTLTQKVVASGGTGTQTPSPRQIWRPSTSLDRKMVRI